MKKLGIIVVVILILAVGGLWYLGGQQVEAPIVEVGEELANQRWLDPAAAGRVPMSAWQLSANDLLTANDSDPEGTRRYGQRVSQLFQAAGPGQNGAELKLALEALNEQAPGKAAVVRREAERYSRLAAELKQVEVPNELKSIHLNLLNAVLGLAEIDWYLADVLTEPIVALDQAQILAGRYERLAVAVMILNQVLAFHNLPLVAAL